MKYLNKITAGNCKELLQELPDESIDLVVTSPPYDNLRTYKGYDISEEYCEIARKRVAGANVPLFVMK